MTKPTQQVGIFLELIQKDSFLLASRDPEDKDLRELRLQYYVRLCDLSDVEIEHLNMIFPKLNLKV